MSLSRARRPLVFLLLFPLVCVVCVVPPSREASAICSGGPPRPFPVRENPRYGIGDYERWWGINRDDILLTVKEVSGDFPEYERKGPPPDSLKTLLSLVGYEGDFCSIVKQVGLKRLRKFPKAGEAMIALLSDRKALPQERSWAAYALGDLRCRKAVPALTEALKDSDSNVRGFAALALGKMGDAVAIEALLPLAVDAKQVEDLRCLVLLSLATAELPKAREVLIQVARRDVSVPARRAALMALGVNASPEGRKLLIDSCEDRDALIRAAAVLGLGFSGQDRETVLRHAGRKERDATVRGYAALSLGITGAPETAPDLIEVLKNDADAQVRGCAALALGRVRAPGVLEALVEAVQSRHSAFVADFAAISLGLTGRKEALPFLVQGLESRQFDLITSSAAGIALLGLPEGMEPLRKSLENKNHAIVREYAAVAIGRLRPLEGKACLIKCLEDPSAEVRHAAAIALAVYGDASACPALEKALSDKQAPVRMTASLAFDYLTDDETRPLTLGDRFKADPRNQVSRTVGLLEINRLLNSHMPPNYKLPVTP